MEEIAIRTSHLCKIYRTYDNQIDRLKEALNPLKKKYHKNFYALDDINFEVKKGETVGIIGKNGSGKSTLLKIITGVLTQTKGESSVEGKVSALLELGAGFNLEYTGLENIYLNGTLMGYSKEEVDQKLQAIFDFADIGNFIYQPVKTYSSGMFARLAFSVAINVEPDILIVDEALSVGDVFFQNKCFKKFDELREKGVTILFVSHDLGSIKQMCSRVLWINEGSQIMFGDKEEVCNAYLNFKFSENNKHIIVENIEDKREVYRVEGLAKVNEIKKIPSLNNVDSYNDEKQGRIVSFYVTNSKGEKVNYLEVEKEYNFHIAAEFFQELKDVLFGFILENNKGIPLFAINNFLNSKVLKKTDLGKVYEAVFKLKLPKILKGEYLISPALATGDQKNHETIHWLANYEKVEVINSGYNLSLIEIESDVEIQCYPKENIIFE
ncbi:ABC transporter ATP-binding protein [uncultured Ilyobacter sp.]|uniref:ABC transporter ATP-binding protein n=1 Tax=uncultured Ilyobacter sp. TaxID=544433 RepID=UPI002AA93BD2|nr:ABC transporter ATP-binding protein [uncultured Ilyobacter sp.]